MPSINNSGMTVQAFCPKCGSPDTISRGIQIFCKTCRKFTNKDSLDSTNTTVTDNGNTMEIAIMTEAEIRTEEELIRVCKIDLNIWYIEKWSVGVSPIYRKDRFVEWDVSEGHVVHGKVRDSGKLIYKQAYAVKVVLKRKTEEIRANSAIEDMLKELKKASPKVKRYPYKKHKSGMIYEIDMPDLHFGKLTWNEESGDDYDIKIAKSMALVAIQRLLDYAALHPISQILLPWGNDFFNVDNTEEGTTAGTPQQEDTRWKKTFREGRRLTQQIIDMCTQIAPVDILFIPGNHDVTRLFYLGEAIGCRYENDKNVSVDNSAKSRKYRHYDNVLLGFAHGDNEKFEKLPTTMSMDMKEAWSRAAIREWHLGHIHQRKQFELKHEEQLACTVRFLSSLTGTDTWHFENQYIGNIKSASAFLWHPMDGLVAEYHALGSAS